MHVHNHVRNQGCDRLHFFTITKVLTSNLNPQTNTNFYFFLIQCRSSWLQWDLNWVKTRLRIDASSAIETYRIIIMSNCASPFIRNYFAHFMPNFVPQAVVADSSVALLCVWLWFAKHFKTADKHFLRCYRKSEFGLGKSRCLAEVASITRQLHACVLFTHVDLRPRWPFPIILTLVVTGCQTLRITTCARGGAVQSLSHENKWLSTPRKFSKPFTDRQEPMHCQ